MVLVFGGGGDGGFGDQRDGGFGDQRDGVHNRPHSESNVEVYLESMFLSSLPLDLELPVSVVFAI